MELLDIAKEGALEGGKVLMGHYLNLKEFTKKTGAWDIVTVADREAQDAVIKKITALAKKHMRGREVRFLAEEGVAQETNDIVFIIDPLDGTSNFESGFPIFCVSIGVMEKGRITHGVVFDPVRNILYMASKGRGARRNGKPMKVRRGRDLQDSLLLTYRRASYFLSRYDHPYFMRDSRSTGSLAFDLCTIASGQADILFTRGGRVWDFAAGAVILEEAGGVLLDWKGRPLRLKALANVMYPAVAGEPALVKKFIPYVKMLDPKNIPTLTVEEREVARRKG